MYTILRIHGPEHLHSELLARIKEHAKAPPADPGRPGSISIDLSKHEEWDAHQREIEAGILGLASIVGEARRVGCQVYVDTAVYVPPPDGTHVAVTVRAYRLSSSLMDLLVECELPYELTVYVGPSGDVEDQVDVND